MERKCTRGFLVCLAVLGLAAMPSLAQDECADAQTLTCVGSPETYSPCTDSVVLDPGADTTPGGGLYGACISGNSTLDAWALFVPSHTNARLRTDLGSVGTDSHFSVYSSVAQGGTPADLCNPGSWQYVMGCSEDEAGFLGDISFAGLVPGDTYVVQLGGWGDYTPAGDTYTLTYENPAPGGQCGDGVVSAAGDEECDGLDDAACQLSCLGDCTCDPVPVPTLPEWGLLGLAALLLGGGAVVFGRLRA